MKTANPIAKRPKPEQKLLFSMRAKWILQAYKEGYNKSQISDILNCNHAIIVRVIQKYEKQI